MPPENVRTRYIDVAGYQSCLISYFLNTCYVAEVQVDASAATIALSIGEDRRSAENKAVEKAVRRLQNSHAASADLMVGG